MLVRRLYISVLQPKHVKRFRFDLVFDVFAAQKGENVKSVKYVTGDNGRHKVHYIVTAITEASPIQQKRCSAITLKLHVDCSLLVNLLINTSAITLLHKQFVIINYF